MNLKFKSDVVLEQDLKTLRQKELALTAELLHHLLEVETRDLHLARGFESINAYCIKVLGYSDDEAYVRVKAMRLIKVLPVAEEHLRDGSVGLTNLFKTQSAFVREDRRRREEKEAPLTSAEKADILEQVKHKSSRECEKVLAANYPDQKVHVEKMKLISSDRWLLELTISNELKEKIDTLFDLRAHTNFNRKLEKLLEDLVELGLDRFDPVRRSWTRARRAEARAKKDHAAHAKRAPAPVPENQDKKQNANDVRIQEVSFSNEVQDGCGPYESGEQTLKSEQVKTGSSEGPITSVSHQADEPLLRRSENSSCQNRSADSFVPPVSVDFVGRKYDVLKVSNLEVASVDVSNIEVGSTDVSDLEVASIDVSKRQALRPYVSIVTRDTIFTEADGRCSYVDDLTGRRCANRHAPQQDHRVPFALGGSGQPEIFVYFAGRIISSKRARFLDHGGLRLRGRSFAREFAATHVDRCETSARSSWFTLADRGCPKLGSPMKILLKLYPS